MLRIVDSTVDDTNTWSLQAFRGQITPILRSLPRFLFLGLDTLSNLALLIRWRAPFGRRAWSNRHFVANRVFPQVVVEFKKGVVCVRIEFPPGIWKFGRTSAGAKWVLLSFGFFEFFAAYNMWVWDRCDPMGGLIILAHFGLGPLSLWGYEQKEPIMTVVENS